MSEEIHHRRKLPPIERTIRRIRDRIRAMYSRAPCDWIDLACCFTIGVIVTGLVFFAIESLRRARP